MAENRDKNRETKPKPETRGPSVWPLAILGLLVLNVFSFLGGCNAVKGEASRDRQKVEQEAFILAQQEAWEKGFLEVVPETLKPGQTPSFRWTTHEVIAEQVVQKQLAELENQPQEEAEDLPLPKKSK